MSSKKIKLSFADYENVSMVLLNYVDCKNGNLKEQCYTSDCIVQCWCHHLRRRSRQRARNCSRKWVRQLGWTCNHSQLENGTAMLQIVGMLITECSFEMGAYYPWFYSGICMLFICIEMGAYYFLKEYY